MLLFDTYKLTKLISLDDEPYLEKWARLFRYNTSLPVIKMLLKKKKQIALLDVGCGQDVLYHKFLEYHFPDNIHRFTYVGLDPLIDKKKVKNSITVVTTQYEKYLQATKDQYDLITIFAVLEHVDDPTDLMVVLSQLLAVGGYLIGTTPTKPAKPVLEFLSYKLGYIAEREIDEHKNYFDRNSIQKIFRAVTKNDSFYTFHKYFETVLNNFFLVKKV